MERQSGRLLELQVARVLWRLVGFHGHVPAGRRQLLLRLHAIAHRTKNNAACLCSTRTLTTARNLSLTVSLARHVMGQA